MIKRIYISSFESDAISESPCMNLGSKIFDQMYTGIDQSNSTLVSGEYDDDDNWDVDPACDMNTDRFDVRESPVVKSQPDTPVLEP